MPNKSVSFRVGRVQVYRRGRVWYLCYHDHGRRRPRVGPDPAARQLAAQINSQLELGTPAALSFEPLPIPELRQRWLEHHEQVLRSSVQTISRYRTATDHFLRFVQEVRPVRYASQFHAHQAEDFVRYLRKVQVAPNGHVNARKRPLMDKGVKFILESCRALSAYALKHRHLFVLVPAPRVRLSGRGRQVGWLPDESDGRRRCFPEAPASGGGGCVVRQDRPQHGGSRASNGGRTHERASVACSPNERPRLACRIPVAVPPDRPTCPDRLP